MATSIDSAEHKAAATKARMDGWRNVLNGVGGNGDRLLRNAATYTAKSYEDMHTFIKADALVQTILELYIREIKADKWTLPLDTDGTIAQAMVPFLSTNFLQDVMQICLVEGGCLIRLEADGLFASELGENSKVLGLTAIPPSQIKLDANNFEQDPEKPGYGEVQYYEIKKPFSGTYLLHASRTIAIRRPTFLNDTSDLGRWYWGNPELEKLFEICSALSIIPTTSYNLFSQFGVTKYTLSNMEQIVAAGDWNALEQRLLAIQEQKSFLHGVFMGEGEKAEIYSPDVDGVPPLAEFLLMLCSCFSHIPQAKLFGRNFGGLTSSGEGDEKNLGMFLEGLRNAYLIPVIKKVGDRLAPQLRFDPARLAEVVWPDMPINEGTMAEIKHKVAQTDEIYFKMGALSAEEIRVTRFINGYSTDFALNDPNGVQDDTIITETASRIPGAVHTDQPVENGV